MNNASVAGIVAIAVVAVICLAIQLIATTAASRRPFFARPKPESMPTGIRGGRHAAVGGRSVMPHRTAPATPMRGTVPTPAAAPAAPTPPAAAPAAAAAEPAQAPAPGGPRARLREDGVPVPRANQDAPERSSTTR